MPTYIVIERWTDQGVRAVKETVKRYRAAMKQAEAMGIKDRGFFWTMGQHDAVGIVDAPNEEAATALSLAIASQGNVRTETVRAYSAEEMERILAELS